MEKNFPLQTAQEQAKVLALAFNDNDMFDVDAAIEQISQHLDQKPLTKKQLELLSQFSREEISSSVVNKKFNFLSKFLGEPTTDNSQPEEEAITHSTSGPAENSSLLTRIFSSSKNYPYNPKLKQFPHIRPDARQALEDDVEKAGKIHKPIILYKGQIVDGRARKEICKKFKITPIYMEWDGKEEDLQEYMDSIHVHKKDLTQSQRAILALENLKRFENE